MTPTRLAAPATLAVTLACLLLAGPARAAPRGFFSVQAWDVPTQAEFQRIGNGGIGTFRTVIDWGAVEPTKGARVWDYYDRIFQRAAVAGVRVLPVLTGPPYFGRGSTPPPRTAKARARFAAFARDAVARYGPGGAFWAAHPELRALPPTAWQIWNEPNFPVYWGGRPNPRQYVALLKVAYAAVKARDPRARVVLGGLPETALGVGMVPYLRGVYAVRGAKRAFDAVAIHPYARDWRGVLGAITRVRAAMGAAGDGRTQLWITETGWASGGPVSARTRAFRTTEKGQASRLRATVSRLLGWRARYRIGLINWFSWRDRSRRHRERDWWAIHTGLLRRSGKAKPAWLAYSRLARGG
jgi:hypothetical protein